MKVTLLLDRLLSGCRTAQGDGCALFVFQLFNSPRHDSQYAHAPIFLILNSRQLRKARPQAVCHETWRHIMVRKAHVLTLACRGWRYFLFALVGFVFACSSTSAQTATGRIMGTVTDAQGAAIAGAKVTVTNAGTNGAWNTVTN